MKEIKEGEDFKICCAVNNCKQTLQLKCINSSTMEAVTMTGEYFDMRNMEWVCFIHRLKTRPKNYHRYEKVTNIGQYKKR